MEYKYNDLKEYLIKNGNRKEVGVANNKIIVYEYQIGRNYNKSNDGPIKDYYFEISYDGKSAVANSWIHPYDFIRYNETKDCVQGASDNIYGYAPKYKTLNFDENGRLKYYRYFGIFLNVGEDKEYAKQYYEEHINDAIKIIKSNMKTGKILIKHTEKKIKEYEKILKELEDKLMQLTAVPSKLQNHE